MPARGSPYSRSPPSCSRCGTVNLRTCFCTRVGSLTKSSPFKSIVAPEGGPFVLNISTPAGMRLIANTPISFTTVADGLRPGASAPHHARARRTGWRRSTCGRRDRRGSANTTDTGGDLIKRSWCARRCPRTPHAHTHTHESSNATPRPRLRAGRPGPHAHARYTRTRNIGSDAFEAPTD
eukprot:scaffold82532_cov75-Phaeocystis_antarctica.AAC.2